MRTSELEILLAKDPLSELTRKSRHNLLITGFASIIVTKAHIIPKKIAVLGIEFSEPQQEVFLYTLAGLIIYFLVQFSVYLLSDITRRNMEAAKLAGDAELLDSNDKEKKWGAFSHSFADGELTIAGMRQYFWRWNIDVIFPFVFTIYVLFVIWTALF